MTEEEKCCEDEKGNALCEHLLGVWCIAIKTGPTSYKNFRVTKDAINVLRHVGCPLFKLREQRRNEAVLSDEKWT
jgi:hypothetical protein